MLPAVCLALLQSPWPAFRGPDRSGRAPAVELPADFDLDLDRIWRRELPPGHSSPILAGDGIVLTACRDGQVFTLCCDARDGRTRWERVAPVAPFPADGNSEADPAIFAASTPVTDGRGVFVPFPDYGLVCYELSGEERWRLPLGRLHAPYPSASSPALSGGKLVHLCDHDRGSFLIAVDPEDGSVLWRTARPFATHGYSSPAILGDDVVVSGSHRADAYDLRTGELLWWVEGLSWQARATPVGGDGIAYVQSAMQPAGAAGSRVVSESFDEALAGRDADGDGRLVAPELEDARLPGEWFLHDLDGSGALDAVEWERLRARLRSDGGGLWAIRLGGTGDVGASHVAWTLSRRVPVNATPLLVGDVLVTVRDGGLASGLDARDGAEHWATRIDGMSSDVYASPVAIGEDVLAFDQRGALAVLDPRDGSVRSTHELGEAVMSTPAVGADAFYVRTAEALHAFRLGAGAETAAARAFVGVDVLTMDADLGTLRDQTVVVRDGRVAAIGPREGTPLPPATEVLARGPGWTLAPGLIDAWAHVEDEHELVLHLLAGVTALRTADGRPALLALRERVRAGELAGPAWAIGAPALGPRVATAEAARAVEAGAAAGYDFASAEIGADPEVFAAAAARARELGFPFAGVRPPDLALERALASEPWTLERLETLVVEPELAQALARARIALTPLVSAHTTWIAAAMNRSEWIEDEIALRDVSPIVRVLWHPGAHTLQRLLPPSDLALQRRCQRMQRDSLRALDAAGVELMAGSDAIASFVYPGQGLHRELELFVASGLSPERALRAATSTPGSALARVLGGPRGTVAVGAAADLILIAGDPLADLRLLEQPRGTMSSGRWYRRGALERALEDARAVYRREAEFVNGVAQVRSGRTAELIEFLGRSEMLELDLRESTARRMVELLLHPGLTRADDAAAVAAYADRRWPAERGSGATAEPDR